MLKNAPNLPKIVNQAAEHIDKVSNGLIFGSGLNLDIVQNTKHSFNAPTFSIFIDIEMLTFLSGVCGKHPIVSFAVGKTLIPLDEYVTNFNLEC